MIGIKLYLGLNNVEYYDPRMHVSRYEDIELLFALAASRISKNNIGLLGTQFIPTSEYEGILSCIILFGHREIYLGRYEIIFQDAVHNLRDPD